MRIGVVLLMLFEAAVSLAAVVRLRESATVSGAVMTVGQIAEVRENDSYRQMQISQVEIGPVPEEESPKWVDLAEVKEALSRAGVRLDEVSFSGSRRVEVRRAASEPARVVTKKTREYWRTELERLMRENLEEESRRSADGEAFAGSGPMEGVGIRVEGERLLDLLVEQPSENWRLVLPDHFQPGWQQARVDVPVAEKVLRYPIMIHLTAGRQVVVPRVPVSRGSTITADDVMLVAFEKDSSAEGLVSDLRDAVGQEAKRDLRAGEPIYSRDIRKTPIVFRGQPINVHIRYGTAWLQKTFLAASDAGAGEWIEVYEANGRTNQPHPYQVKVVGPHTAELPPQAPPSRAASRASFSPAKVAQRPTGRRAN
jgi:flagella basal body P-ring formation protein FlgA